MTETTTMMLTRLTVSRVGYSPYSYSNPDPTKPFQATIEVHGIAAKVELTLSSELSRRILEIVADEVAAAGRATAEIMVADALLVNTPALAKPA